jgi:hypothetical protein
MDRNALQKFEARGLKCPFTSSKSGDVTVTENGESLKMEISQLATVVFETIGAVGDIKVDRIEVHGEQKGLIMELDAGVMIGSFFDQAEGVSLDSYWTLLDELKSQPVGVVEEKPRPVPEEKVIVEKAEAEIKAAVPKEEKVEEVAEKAEVSKEIPEAKAKVKLDAHIIDEMKEKSKEFLGDFTERIYQNQIKAQRIKFEEFYDEDARRLIFALGKAAGMIIGPSKGREMTNKLLDVLK